MYEGRGVCAWGRRVSIGREGYEGRVGVHEEWGEGVVIGVGTRGL